MIVKQQRNMRALLHKGIRIRTTSIGDNLCRYNYSAPHVRCLLFLLRSMTRLEDNVDENAEVVRSDVVGGMVAWSGNFQG